MTTKNTFAAALRDFAANRNLEDVFRDFLIFSLSQFTHNQNDLLRIEAYARYTDEEVKKILPSLLYRLIGEINQRRNSDQGNDVLGEFYELYLRSDDPNKQILPYIECVIIAEITLLEKQIITKHWPIGFLDVGCRSGRIMLASAKLTGGGYQYLGVEYDFNFVMIATLNLLFNHCTNSEILWVNINNNREFLGSYKIAPSPGGIIRITDKERSNVWQEYQGYLSTKPKANGSHG